VGRVLRSRSVGRDLDRIFKSISANNGGTVAIAQLGRIEALMRRLSLFPSLGRDRSDLAPGLRACSLKPWEVIYRLKGDDVLISRILDGRQNLSALLGKKI
jgi:toxin ParE1/3/4